MASETKVSLLIALGLILLIGIIITDHFSVAQQQQAPAFDAQSAAALPQPAADRSAQAGVNPHPHDLIDPRAIAPAQASPVPLPYELPGNLNDLGPTYQQPPTQPLQAPTTRINPGPVAEAPSYQMQPLHQTIPTPSVTPGFTDPSAGAVAAAGDMRRPQPIIHYVAEGESLWQIAERYYGDGNYWRTIAEANPNRIMLNGQGVRPGVRLLVPNRAGLADISGQGNPQLVQRSAPPSPISGGSIQRVSTQQHPTAAPYRLITVEPGQTLSELASRHLGSANRWQELLDANRDKLSSATSLRSGMKIKVPLAEQAVAQVPIAAPHQTTEGSNATAGRSYTVQAGDTLSSIAQHHLGREGAWHDLFQANRSVLRDNPNNLKVGLQLRMPH